VIINDYIELATLADGLHLGQDDILKFSKDGTKESGVREVRKVIGDKTLGLSTHNLDEVIEANPLDIDYIGLGAYRATQTKQDATFSHGKKLLEVAKSSQKAVALIGGVKIDDNFNKEPQIEYKVIGSDLIRSYLSRKNTH
jgi:thiamine-phosphate pyrophosphorylase